MSIGTNTPRLLAAAKEFNIGKETLVDFLKGKGFEIDASKPTAKLTEEMYSALQNQFAQAKDAKKKSESIALPKGSLIDSLHKTQEQLDITAKDKKEEKPVEAKKVEKAEPPKAVEKPVEKPAPQPEPKVEEKPAPVAEKPAEPVKPEPKPEPIPEPVVQKAEPAPKPVEEKKAEPQPEPAPAKEEAAEPEHIEMQSPKLEGPKVQGKINLDDLNLSTRPKKGAPAKKKEEPKKVAELKKEAPRKEAPPKKAETPQAPEVKVEAPKPAPVAETPKEVPAPAPEAIEDNTPEHIEMKAPKLEGPKIIGKIDLPVNTVGGKQERKDKRKRKRIPLEGKKPEGGGNTHQGQGGGHQGQGQNRPPRPAGQGGDNRNRPAGQGQQGSGQGGQNRGPRPGGGYQGQGGQNRPGQGGDRNRPNRNAPVADQEIDAKAIQDKIRETQAKLSGGGARNKNLKAKYRRNKREEMAEKRAAAEQENDGSVIQVTEFISVSELANLLDVSFADVISKCMSLGIMVSINQRLDAEVIELVASEFDREVEFINLEESSDDEVEDIDAPEDLKPRAPIVTIMGHVDHGKTSLLDYIRNASVVAGEAGGITQHIGAYKVTTESGKEIAFLDTPGHEAFTAMRARGAKAADIAVIVIAADDAIMPQTREAISHAQAANLPMIFAINKIDREGSNPEKIREQLSAMNILVEEWGGKFQSQEISAKKGTNIDLLLEKILLEAELLELTANPNKEGVGSTIEASLDKGRGYVSTVLVQSGTLNSGDMIVSGQYFGKIKAMFNERGQKILTAGPSTPVQVLGLNGAPQAGEKFKVYKDESEAKNVANHRAQIMREQGLRSRKHITLDEIGRRLALGNFKELNVIIKADFDGSAEALSDSLQKLSTEEVVVNVVLKGVGQITESDVMLASASDAIMLGFQVRPSPQAARLADQENIEIRYYSIIYDAIAEIKSAMEGLLEPSVEKKVVGNIEVREVYKISGVGTIAGCYVTDGKISRQTKINIIRDGIVVHTGELASLKRFKDDVKEVNFGYECGLSIKNYNDIQVGDVLEGYEEVEVKRKLA
ncbi:translation initiation factor IF-2 [Taibaiella lutea]|uniref:Translation initiation factor IF-2 n=1 Tax=Taibaiella lutea TaxID=2608001 RepID=A0A5M6CHN8_9BACT|nr:translation initiation factor IF-2 [Taibaiella lutea]KAA5533452.1 translation initiation factor IF-2 [Taibaiella lutea]